MRARMLAAVVVAVAVGGCGQAQPKGTMLDTVATAVTRAQQGPTMLDTVANAVKSVRR